MPLYEVKIETRNYEWYEVRAKSVEEARDRWHEGTLTGTEEVEVMDIISVTEEFDDEEVDYAEDEDYESYDVEYDDGYYANVNDSYGTGQ